jgi:MFS family permease
MPLILTPFRFYNFRLWTAANSVSVAGTWMQVLAANWLLLGATGSAAQMGLGVLAHAGPGVLLGPWAGTLADRLPARPLLTVTQLAHALIAALIGVAAMSGGAVVLVVYAAMLLGGLVTALESPAFGRFGSLMVDRSHLGAALAVGSLANSAGRILGMSAGGVLVATIGPGPLFLANAASFLVVIGVMYLLRTVPPGSTEAGPKPAGTRVPHHRVPEPAGPTAAATPGTSPDTPPPTTWAGLRYLCRDPMVLITLGLAFLLGSLGRNYQVTMAAMSAGPLGGGPDAYGMLSTVFAAGTVAGGLVAAHAGRFRLSQIAAVGLGMSALQALSGLTPGLLWFAVTLLPIAAGAVLVDTVVSTRMQLDNPLALRGRVLGAVGATGAIAGAIGAPVLGWLSDLLGPRGALLLAGVFTVVGSALALAGYAAVRRRREGAPTGARAEAPARAAATGPAPTAAGVAGPAPTAAGVAGPAPTAAGTTVPAPTAAVPAQLAPWPGAPAVAPPAARVPAPDARSG